MMPGGSPEAYQHIKHIMEKVAAQVDGPCVTYVGAGGAGNFVKMVRLQLIRMGHWSIAPRTHLLVCSSSCHRTCVPDTHVVGMC